MADSLNIAIIQSNLHWQDPHTNIKTFLNKISTLNENVHLVILPEMFTTGFTMLANTYAETMDGHTVNWMREAAIKSKKAIIGSVIIKEENKFYNRCVCMLPNGDIYTYDKRHLFGMAGEDEVFTKGKSRIVVQFNGFKLLLQICYDLRFPVWNRQVASKEYYDGIVYLANWPTKRIAHWDALLQARAIENQCYVLACNRVGLDGNGLDYCGNSQVIAPNGIIIEKQTELEAIIYATLYRDVIRKTQIDLPFLEDADDFLIL
jgi:omega-amidase